MQKLNLLGLLLFVIFSIPVTAQTTDSLLNQLSRKWVHTKAHTLTIAELMPEEHYGFKPVGEIMSFEEQLLHMADNMRWLTSTFLFSTGKTTVNKKEKPDKAAILKIISEAYDQAYTSHLKLQKFQLDEVVPFFAGPKTRRQMLLLLHDHQTHHAGQLILYLRLKGIKPPDYVGW